MSQSRTDKKQTIKGQKAVQHERGRNAEIYQPGLNKNSTKTQDWHATRLRRLAAVHQQDSWAGRTISAWG